MRSLARTLPFVLILSLAPALAYAALVNINTADLTTLETLSGIGPSKGTAIITYRTQHGPFVRIEDIQNVSGIGPSTFATIQALITVGDSSSSTPSTESASSTATTTVVASTSGSASTYVPPPSALTIDVGLDRLVTLHVPISFTAIVKAKGGAADPSATILWSFGDGSSAQGTEVEKTYWYPGVYAVTATAADGLIHTHNSITVTVSAASVSIASISGEGITLRDENIGRLDISGWHLAFDKGSFRFPDGTTLLPSANVLIPWTVINLPITLAATLSYPDGVVVARYPSDPAPIASAPAQPIAADKGSQRVQMVESVLSNISPPAHAPQAFDAPTVAPITAAVGAAMPDVPPTGGTSSPVSMGSIFHSGWMLGVLGIIALAGGAFMIL